MKIEAISDIAILKKLGSYLKDKRIEGNITQEDLAKMTGISRRSIVSIENGAGGRVHTLIELLRALKALDMFEIIFQEKEINPLELLKQQKRIRHNAFRKRK